MKIKINKNELGLLIEFQYGCTYLVRWENIPDEWIDYEIKNNISYWQYDAPEKERKIMSREESRSNLIEEIKAKSYEELEAQDITRDCGCGKGWDEFEKEIFVSKPFDLSAIWDDENSWE